MKKFAMFLFAGVAALCFLGASFLIWQHYTPSRLAFSSEELALEQQTISTYALPQTLLIPSLGIDAPIYPAKVAGGRWETTSKGVSYLSGSSLPGEPGNSVFYGHNWTNILGRLPQAKPGQEILLRWGDGKIERLVIVETMEVTPDQTHILARTDDTRVTIYTCSGFLDRKRFVVVAILT